ncbi:integral membrane protein [Corynascus similis CBS 632.67]
MAVSTPSRRGWDSGIPIVLRPLVRAYLFGYVSAAGPRLLTLLLQHVARHRRSKQQTTTASDPRPDDPFLAGLRRILLRPLSLKSFPTACAVLIGGTTFLELPLKSLLDRYGWTISEIARRRLARWLASFIAAWLSLRLLQSKQTPSFTDIEQGPDGHPRTVRYAGRTLDLTFLAVTRALDVVVGELWRRRRIRREAAGRWTGFERAASRLADPAVFALSSGLIMWTWIYQPSRLPRAYNKWIGSAAAVDARLITALQRCRDGTLLYGEDTGQAPLLGSMCADYGWPAAWGDPAQSLPFPCEMVHMGCGPSCEYHALSRLARSFRWAMMTYLPLSLLLAARSGKRGNGIRALRRALTSAARSSAFLGSFIALFYYGVCLARTRLGPRLLGGHPAERCQHIDGGLCVGAGCALCGWSILLENPGRRKDIALFVAPRAMATLFPRRYAPEKQWREALAFAASAAVVVAAFAENRASVRGVAGGVLSWVFRE